MADGVMGAYSWVPNVDGLQSPQAQYIVDHGIVVATSLDGTERAAWVKMEVDTPIKICGYYSGTTIYTVCALTESISPHMAWARMPQSTWNDNRFRTSLDSTTGLYYYRDYFSSLPQPNIPIYNNLRECLEAMNDNIWVEPSDPYGAGGISGIGGGTGNFDGTGDNIDFPSLPTLSAVDAGFITLYNPSAAQLRALASYMWSDLFSVDGWKKIFADPMDAILGMSIVPVAVPGGGTREISVGNIPTGVSLTIAASQYVTVDCGTLNVNEYWGAYLDYAPYTRAELYLPYIGIHPISVDDIMGKPVHIVYHVDILSGACCAYVKCGGSVMYSFVGQCSCSIPITGNDWSNVVNGALSIAASIGSMVASGGATAPMAVTSMASTAVNATKPTVEKSGAMGGMGGMLGVQTPYLILSRPRQAIPAQLSSYTGYPSYITSRLSKLQGYTVVDSIHLTGIPATDEELDEIEQLLKEGVIL